MKRFFSLLALGALFLSVPAVSSAQIIYDAIPDDGNGIVNQVFPDFTDFSAYLVADVTIASDVTLGVIDIYGFEGNNPPPTITWEGNVITATFNIFTKTSSLPNNATDDPSAGTTVPIDCLEVTGGGGGDGTGQYLITACGINMPLTAGSYWIGLTPEADFTTYSQVFSFGSLTIQGEQAAIRNPGGGFDLDLNGTPNEATDKVWFPVAQILGTPWELAMQIRQPESCGGGGGCVPPASFEVFRGIQLSGDLASFADADGNVATFNPGFTINNTEAPVWLVFEGNNASATEISVTSTAGTPGIGIRAECFNWTTGMYVQIGAQEDEAFNMQTKHIFGPIDAACIDGSGNVKWRIGWRKKGFTINFPWLISVDATAVCDTP